MYIVINPVENTQNDTQDKSSFDDSESEPCQPVQKAQAGRFNYLADNKSYNMDKDNHDNEGNEEGSDGKMLESKMKVIGQVTSYKARKMNSSPDAKNKRNQARKFFNKSFGETGEGRQNKKYPHYDVKIIHKYSQSIH